MDASARVVYLASKLSILVGKGEPTMDIKKSLDQAYEELMQTRVSICTSVYNQSDLLKGMIESVVAQTFKEWELIIVDDGSTEDVKSVVTSFDDSRIRYFSFNENRGIPHGSNEAMSIACGEYASWLAADERISPTKLADQVEYLDSHPKVDAVWGMPGYFGGQDLGKEFGPRPDWEQYTYRAHNRSNEAWLRTLITLDNIPLGTCSMLARRKVLKDLGPMDENLKAFSDHELYCRFFERGHIGVVLPHRWAIDVPSQGAHRTQETVVKELEYVRNKHPIIVPKSSGKITVGIPCYNHARFLKETVESVLAQTKPVDEILILNDASTDNFEEVAAECVALAPGIVKLMAFPENMGCQEAKSQMAFRAEGDFFVVLSADDTISPTFVEKCMERFELNPWLEFVATQTDFISEDGSPYTDRKNLIFQIPKASNRTREEWLQVLRGGNLYFGAGIYRTLAISDLGGWKKEFKIIDDYEMYLKLLQRENISIVEEDLTHTRVHGSNQSMAGMGKELQEQLPWLYHAARKPYYRQLMRVVIATPFYEVKAWSPYIASLVETIRLLSAVGIDWRFMELSGDSYVHRARNTMCDRFLSDPDNTDLFFIDSDMSWNPDAFVNMCILPDDIIGGSYPVKNGWDKWTSIPEMKESEGAYHYQGRDLGNGTALLKAHVLAGGFLRIKRHVLEKYREFHKDHWYVEASTNPDKPQYRYTQFFASQKDADGQFYGEDHWFSKRIREMGTQMMIYPDATITHFGVNGWSGNLDKWLKDKKYSQDRTQAAQ